MQQATVYQFSAGGVAADRGDRLVTDKLGPIWALWPLVCKLNTVWPDQIYIDIYSLGEASSAHLALAITRFV